MQQGIRKWNLISLIFIICAGVYRVDAIEPYSKIASLFDNSSCDANFGIRSITFSPDNKYLLSSWSLGEARLWNIATGALLESFFMNSKYDITDVTFSHDSETIATANAHEVTLWNTQNGQKRFTILREHQDDVWTEVEFSVTDKFLLTSGYDGATTWDAQSGEKLKTFSILQDRGIDFQDRDIGQQSVLSSDSRYVVTFSYQNTAMSLWDVTSGNKIHEFPNIRIGKFTPDAKAILTYGQDGIFILWDLKTFQKLWQSDPKAPILNWSYSRYGAYFVVLEDTKIFNLSVYSLDNGQKLYVMPLTPDTIPKLFDFILDDKQLIVPSMTNSSGKRYYKAKILNWDTKQFVRDIDIGQSPPTTYQISLDEQYLALGTSTGSVMVWNLVTSEEPKSFC